MVVVTSRLRVPLPSARSFHNLVLDTPKQRNVHLASYYHHGIGIFRRQATEALLTI